MQVFKCNVDYFERSKSTWGCHESYLHRANPQVLPGPLIPFLVSRIIFTGSGGFNSLIPDLEFLISPRVEFLVKEISSKSTHERGIFHTKDEPLCQGGYHRLHLLCGESNCSQVASFLKVGTTALVVAMIEAGLRVGTTVKLQSPIAAMRTFARDPQCSLTAKTYSGKELSAVEIQRHYLAKAEAHLKDPFMPDWAREVTQLWGWILDRLEKGAPDSVTGILDWGLKFRIFNDRVRRQGFLFNLNDYGKRSPKAPPVAKDTLPRTLGRFMKLREELFEIDMRFSQLGEKSIFAELDKKGLINHHVVKAEDVSRATDRPPLLGRGRLRGRWVNALAGSGPEYACDWDSVYDFKTNRALDLKDPFEVEQRWKDLGRGRNSRPPNARTRVWDDTPVFCYR
jgi:hypothetical protein